MTDVDDYITMLRESQLKSTTVIEDVDKIISENKQLKKQLEISEKALEEYARKDLWDDCYVEDFVNSHPKCAFYSNGYEIAEDALFEIKLIKKSNEVLK